MNKKMTMYICMQLLFLSGCDIKGMEIDQHIPENNIYQYSGPEKCFYELHPNGLFSQDGLNMPENQTNKMYHGKLLASNNGFFVQIRRMPHASVSESHISPELVLLPIHATSKQKKQLFELLKNQQMSSDKFIFMIDNSSNSYKITQLEQTSQSYEYISSLSSTCSTSGSSHEEESITEAPNDDKQEREYEIQNKSELSSLSPSFIEKSQQLKPLGQMRDQKQIHYMLACAALVMISAALLYKYRPLFS